GGSFQPTVQVLDPASNTIASGAAGVGVDLVLQTIPLTAAGTYTITLGDAGGATGLYSLQVGLNAAVEGELHGGPPNNTIASAQDLSGSFIPLDGGADRGAVLGQVEPPGLTNYTATAVPFTFEDISTTGTPTLQNVDDAAVTLGPAELGGFTFPFYTQTYDTLSISSNGLITFGGPWTQFTNQDLSPHPPPPS